MNININIAKTCSHHGNQGRVVRKGKKDKEEASEIVHISQDDERKEREKEGKKISDTLRDV
ncbi:hypothetical protein N7456_010921 [Penicillium angulare]|uniref:Uncharacterized protein n=1 Tax=Penicillium angulare TaxID=116970 RepID=A0A9W9ET29_9EURO|nr:hypothetical protein N7456_010921 [Penicillium angulare]